MFQEGELTDGFERPVMIHRAILGSVERMIAVLTEHTGGKWPFWLSPRQAIVVPIGEKYFEYATQVTQQIDEDEERSDKITRSEICVAMP